MANKKDTTYFGLTGGQAWFAVIVIAALITLAGYGPLAADSTETATTVTTPTTAGAVADPSLLLNSEFVSVVINGSTIADINTNFDEDSNTISLQFDAEAINANVTNSTYVLKTKTTAGTGTNVSEYLESGALAEPLTDNTVLMNITLTESVLGGFGDTQEVKYSTVSATVNQLTDSSGEKFYPIAVRSGSTTLPEIRVDNILDSCSYSWVATTTQRTIVVSCYVSWTGINTMDDISDKIRIPIVCTSGDDTPLTVEIIRNSAL